MPERRISPILRVLLSTSLFACAGVADDEVLEAETLSSLTTTLTPSADTYARSGSDASRNFGGSSTVQVDQSHGGAIKQGYVRFDVGAVGAIAKATLRLYVTDSSANSAQVWTISSKTWSETALTWNTKPAIDGVRVATIGKTSSSTWIELDVTSVVQAGQVLSLAIVAASTDGFDFSSRESSRKPQLVIDLAMDGGGGGSGSGSGGGTYDDDTHATLASGAPIQVVSGDKGYAEYRHSASADGKALVLDARTAAVTVANSRNANPTYDADCSEGSLPVQRYPFHIETADQTAVVGLLVNGKVPQDSDWEPTYQGVNESCNSAAIRIAEARQSVIDGARITSAWDAIRLSGSSSDAAIRNSWITNVRDDAVENDFLQSFEMVDTLVDGAFVGISVRPSSSSTITTVSSNIVTLSGSLIRVRDHLYKGRQNYPGIFKSNELSPSSRIYNTVFALQVSSGATTSSSNWPLTWSKITDCSNNLFLWMSNDPMPSVIGTPPACFTVVKGQAAIDLWNQAKANWVACHPKVVRVAGDPASDPTKCVANTWGGYSD